MLRNSRNCGSGKIKGARNCSCARMAELRCTVSFSLYDFCCVYCYFLRLFYRSFLECAVFHVLSSIDENKDDRKLFGTTRTSVQNIQPVPLCNLYFDSFLQEPILSWFFLIYTLLLGLGALFMLFRLSGYKDLCKRWVLSIWGLTHCPSNNSLHLARKYVRMISVLRSERLSESEAWGKLWALRNR